jgi:hypothetical protein
VTGRELDAVQPGQDPGVGRSAVNDLAARVGEQQPDAATFELTGQLVQDRGRGPSQRPIGVQVWLVRHLEVVGTQTCDQTSFP